MHDALWLNANIATMRAGEPYGAIVDGLIAVRDGKISWIGPRREWKPFGALDNQTRGLMQELLLGIWEAHRKTVLFVTHDIEEAIFMGNRVAVMSARPGRIKCEVRIELPHPRHYTMKTAPEFSRYKAELTEHIRVEALKAAAQMEARV